MSHPIHSTPGVFRSRQFSELSWVGLGLLLLCGLAFAPRTTELGLLHDDWGYFHDVATGSEGIGSPGGLRPLHGLPWRFCGEVFGSALSGYYLVLFALQWAAALWLFRIARIFGPASFAGAFAALAMVFPADASHLWLASMPQRSAWLLALIAVLLAETWRADRREAAASAALVAAAVLGMVSLLMYELHFFLLAAWPLVAGLLGRPWRRRHLRFWLAIPGVYLTWRFVLHPLTGQPAIVNTDLVWDPVSIATRGLLVIPYNLFVEGWWIGWTELIGSGVLQAGGGLALLLAVAVIGMRHRLLGDPPPASRRRCLAAALGAIALGCAPVVPTTYWMGRLAGTFAARVLAAAIPGAAFLLLLLIVVTVPAARMRALIFAALMTVSVGFHWNVARLAVANCVVQEQVARAVQEVVCERGPAASRGSFVVILDLPPNRLGYDTPWGFGRMIREACDDATLSGAGIPADRSPAEILARRSDGLVVHGGAFGSFPWSGVRVWRWRDGHLEASDRDSLLSVPHPTPGPALESIREPQ